MDITKGLTRITAGWRDENGATAIEYGLIMALISLVILGYLSMMGADLESFFQDVADALPG